jgi:hypothetical protein
MTFHLILNERSSLNVGPGLVGDLHDELDLRLEAEVEDGEVDGGSEVVNVGEEDVLAALVNKILHQAGVVKREVEIAVAGWIPPAN